MFRISLALMSLILWITPAGAFNDDYHRAAEIVIGARSQAETATGLRLMSNAALGADADYAPLVSKLLRVQAMPRGLGNAFDILMSTIRDRSQPLTPDRYAQALAPYLVELHELFSNGTADVDAILELGNALLKLDETATKAGLPGIEKIVEAAFGKSPSLGPVLDSLRAVMGLNKESKTGGSRAERLEAEMQNRQAVIEALVPKFAPYGFALPFVTAQLRWVGHGFDQSSRAMEFVGDTIRTGRFDEGRFNQLRDEINSSFSRGPWDLDTFLDGLTNACKSMPELGSYCSDIFRTIKNAFNSAECGPIDCDCDNVQSSFFTEYRKQCMSHELEAKLLCVARREIVIGCRHPFGQAATPLQ